MDGDGVVIFILSSTSSVVRMRKWMRFRSGHKREFRSDGRMLLPVCIPLKRIAILCGMFCVGLFRLIFILILITEFHIERLQKHVV